jgi:preprotein translocase subunit SecD
MKRLLFIFLLTVLAGYVVWPQKPGNYIPGGDALPGNPGIHLGTFARQGAKLGLDLQGGTQLTLQADMSNIPADQRDTAMKGVVNVIQKRVNAYGVAEAEIQTRGTDRLIVQLPASKTSKRPKS